MAVLAGCRPVGKGNVLFQYTKFERFSAISSTGVRGAASLFLRKGT